MPKKTKKKKKSGKKGRKTSRPSKKTAKSPKRKRKSSGGSGNIEFCPDCGSIMIPVKTKKTSYLKCRSCGKQKRKKVRKMKMTEEVGSSKEVAILEKDETLMPKTERECQKCGNKDAYYWLQQTRAADEPPTQFFRCTKCKRVWREYK